MTDVDPREPAMAAVVLAGGRARRLGGVDKVLLPVGAATLLDRVLGAVAGSAPIVVVGPRRATGAPVLWTREEPPGGGPLAGLAAGLRWVPGTAEFVAVLAADHPHVTAATVDRLRRSVGERPGAVLVDPGDRPQWLIGVWRTAALRAAMPADPAGGSLRSAVAGLDPVLVPDVAGESADVDTPDDLRRARDR
ncbi:molybdenum cofactor guanylyltransferase [Saccharopolyspora sp. CA-218241]|uniref:molybdenum cofactor guanylyltransferase n=1 Tax=Saccharopolyspora sp. CA-218241 TaxID=3240027 RepID=UPI003D9A07C3